MSAAAAEELTEEQVARYDRQIRLWGYETQKKLMTTMVCLRTVDNVTMEVGKNLAAAGVNMKIVDETPYTGQLACIIPMENMYEPMATTSQWFAKALRRMNALIKLDTSNEPIKSWVVGRMDRGVAEISHQCIIYTVTETTIAIYISGDTTKDIDTLMAQADDQKATVHPAEAAVVGGLIAQYITNEINGKMAEQWNTIIYRRSDMSAKVTFTELPSQPAATKASESALTKSVAHLEID